MRLTIHLLKDSVVSPLRIWRTESLRRPSDFREVPLRDAAIEGSIYLRNPPARAPDWYEFLRPHCRLETKDEPKVRSCSMVIPFEVEGRWFVATFGRGHLAISPTVIEYDFGLRVALNSLDPDKIRSLQSRNFDPTTIAKQLVANRNAGVRVFDVDFNRELVSKIEGVPTDPAFATRLAGADSLRITVDVEFPGLPGRCKELLRTYRSRRYKKAFPYLGKVETVRDPALEEILDGELVQALQAGGDDSLSFALPDIADYEQVTKYRVQWRRWSVEFDDLDASAILDAVNQDPARGSHCLQVHIVGLDDQGEKVVAFSLDDVVVHQIIYEGATFVRTLRRWHRVDRNYVALVKREIGLLDVVDANGFLPSIRPRETEGQYNERAARATSHLLLDKSLVKASEGAGPIEVCDLYSTKGDFIHVKRSTKSGTLSHLLAQGSVSAQLFQEDEVYRKSFVGRLGQSSAATYARRKKKPEDFRVVYAITAPPGRSLPADLPFFSKVNLLNHVRAVKRLGMKVAICRIPIGA